MLNLGRHTITATVRPAGAVGWKHISSFHRFFWQARWTGDELGLVLIRLVGRQLSDSGPVVVAVDDTVGVQTGKPAVLWTAAQAVDKARRPPAESCARQLGLCPPLAHLPTAMTTTAGYFFWSEAKQVTVVPLEPCRMTVRGLALCRHEQAPRGCCAHSASRPSEARWHELSKGMAHGPRTRRPISDEGLCSSLSHSNSSSSPLWAAVDSGAAGSR